MLFTSTPSDVVHLDYTGRFKDVNADISPLALLDAVMIYIIATENEDIYNMLNETSKKCHHLIVWTTAIPILEGNVAGMVRIARVNEKIQLHMAVIGELTPESTFESINNLAKLDSKKLDASYRRTELLVRLG